MRNNDLDINHQAELRRCSSLDEFFITTPSNQLLLFFALEPPPVDCIFLIHPLYFFATEKLITRQQKVPKNGKFVLNSYEDPCRGRLPAAAGKANFGR